MIWFSLQSSFVSLVFALTSRVVSFCSEQSSVVRAVKYSMPFSEAMLAILTLELSGPTNVSSVTAAISFASRMSLLFSS